LPVDSKPAWLASAAWLAVASSKVTAAGGREEVDTGGARWHKPASGLTWG